MGNNIQSVCRICTSRKVDGKSIFASEKFSDKVMEIQEVIVVCASVQIQRNDRLPKEICSRCLIFLHQAYTFKNLCEDSDFKLRNHVKQNGIESDVMKDVDEELHDFNYSDSDRDLEDTDNELLEELNSNQSIDNSDDSLDADFVEETQISNYSNPIEVEVEEIIETEDLGQNDLLNSESESFDHSDASSDVIFVDEIQLPNNGNSDRVHVKQEKIDCEETEQYSETYLSSSEESNNSEDFKNESLDVSEHKIQFVENGENTESNESTNFVENSESNESTNLVENMESNESTNLVGNTESNESTNLVEHTESNESTNLEVENSVRKKDNSKINSIICIICNKQVVSLKEHMRAEHVREKCFECNICKKQLKSYRALRDHTRIEMKLYKCKVCDKNYSNSTSLRNHMTSHTGENPFKCSKCDKRFRNVSNLNRHESVHNRTNNCGKQISNNNLQRHLRKHKGKNFKCDICGLRYMSNSALAVHKSAKHTNVRSFECDKCSKVFLSRDGMVKHIRFHRSEQGNTNWCNICNKHFIPLKLHMEIHKEKKTFICDICKNQFSRKQNLEIHIKRLGGKQPFKCNICDQLSCSTADFNAHKKKHGEDLEGDFRCYICFHKFATARSLIRHKMLQEGKEKLECNICGKKFCLLPTLSKHKVTCKRYECDVCKKEFSGRGELIQHVRVHIL